MSSDGSNLPARQSSRSTRQRRVLRREQRILTAAETILVRDGFLDMTMARIAQASKCPRSTLYLHFASRQDIVVTLAYRAWQKRLELMERGAKCPGRPRLRMAGIAEGFGLFYRLYPGHFAVLHEATETICEQASPHRLEHLRRAERETADLVRELLDEAVRIGDLKPTRFTVPQMVYSFSALATGGFSLQQMGFPRDTLGIDDPQSQLWQTFGALADACGWRPLSEEIDWEEVLADIRRTVFPKEVERAYGRDAWYGDSGKEHPHHRALGMVEVEVQGVEPRQQAGREA